MGCWDEFCLVCGGPPAAPLVDMGVDDFEGSEQEREALRADLTGLEWLGSYVGVLKTDEVIPLGAYDMLGGFDTHSDGAGVYIWPAVHAANSLCEPNPNAKPALTCHEKCYRLLQRDLAYTLRFHDVWPMLMEQKEARNSFQWTSYGGIADYHEQDFLFVAAVTEGNAWMLHDPTTSARNAERILEVWRPLVQNGFKIPQSGNSDPIVIPAESEGMSGSEVERAASLSTDLQLVKIG